MWNIVAFLVVVAALVATPGDRAAAAGIMEPTTCDDPTSGRVLDDTETARGDLVVWIVCGNRR